MMRTRREQAVFVIQSIRDLGIEPHDQSRLMEMFRLLTETEDVIPHNHPKFKIAVEAVRDMQLLGFVFNHISGQPNNEKFKRLVKHTLKDSSLPQQSGQNTKGRDTQFELFVAAVCESAGLASVRMEEPDVTCTVDGAKFGIAAKRIKSIDKLLMRVADAAKQIHKQRMPGIIALDTCIALNPRNRPVITNYLNVSFARRYKDDFARFIATYHGKIQEIIRGKGVCGVIFHDHQIRYEHGGDWSLASMTWRLPALTDNDQEDPVFRSFEGKYVKGLPNLVDLGSSLE